jgi:hypothetical protein
MMDSPLKRGFSVAAPNDCSHLFTGANANTGKTGQPIQKKIPEPNGL